MDVLHVLVALIALQLSPFSTAADCACGYMVNSTIDRSRALFTEALETDFLHVTDISTLGGWRPQAYQQSPTDARGPYGRIFDVGNVVENPLGSEYDWAGNGVHGGDPGLQLLVRGRLASIDGGQAVQCAELVSDRSDILYGSFRIGMETSPVNGTCSAFFFYRNDTSEIDMEFLSRQQSADNGSVNLVIQSPANGAQGYTAIGSADFATHDLADSPSSRYTEYRFDWLADRVDFYANGHLLQSMTEHVPGAPGRLHISHWSNGNPGWSAGPPTRDAIVTISYVKAYFNSSDSERTTSFAERCKRASGKTSCMVPQTTAPPDPKSPDGNATGHTPFLTNSTTGNPSTHTSGSSHRGLHSKSALLISMLHGVSLVVILGALMVE